MGHSATSLIAWPVRGQACQRHKEILPDRPAQRLRAARFSRMRVQWADSWPNYMASNHTKVRAQVVLRPHRPGIQDCPGNGSARGTRHRLGGAAVSRLVSVGSGMDGGGRQGQVVAIAPGFPGAASTSLREQVERAPPGQELVSACGSGPAGGGGHGRGSFPAGGWCGGWGGSGPAGGGGHGRGSFPAGGWCGGWGGSGPAGGGGHGRGSFLRVGGAGGGVVQVQPVVAVTVAASLLWMRGSADDCAGMIRKSGAAAPQIRITRITVPRQEPSRTGEISDPVAGAGMKPLLRSRCVTLSS